MYSYSLLQDFIQVIDAILIVVALVSIIYLSSLCNRILRSLAVQTAILTEPEKAAQLLGLRDYIEKCDAKLYESGYPLAYKSNLFITWFEHRLRFNGTND